MAENSKKLSIGLLYDDTLDSEDGVANQVKQLGEWLDSQGHSVVYLCGETKASSWANGKIYGLAKNLTVRFNGNKLSIPFYSSGKNIAKVLSVEKLDVIHVQTPYSPLMAQRVIKRAYKNSAIISTFHILPSGIVTSVGAKMLGIFQHYSLKKIDTALSVSQPAKAFSKSAFGLESVVVPNMINLSKFSHDDKSKVNDNEIVFLGRLVKRKGCGQLIEAFRILSIKLPEAKLTIAGSGPDRPMLEKKVAKLGLADKVEFLGFVDEPTKARLLARARVACFPSLYGESFGIVLIEAMASGSKTILGGDNPGYRSVLDQQPLLLVDPKSTNQFADRLEQLITDNKLASEIYDWQQKAVKQYDVNVVGKHLVEIYTRAVANKRQSKA